jgi:hypothetical protein
MLLQGQGHQLYDPASQLKCQARYALRVGTLYIHPPFEALLYLPIARLSLRHAYLLWSFLCLVFLAIAIRCLTKDGLTPWDWRLNLAASITFTPVLLCCIQGQDSSLLLLLMVLAFTALRNRHAVQAGIWLALGLFKFQIVLPMVLVLLLTQRGSGKNLLKAFIMVGFALAAISAAICGPSVFLAYPKFLLALSHQTFSGIVPSAMPNIRGLVWLFFHDSVLAMVATLILSLAAFARTISIANPHRTSAESSLRESQARFDLAFVGAVLFALLVSYHLNSHDLTVALIPIFVLMHYGLQLRRKTRNISKWITWASLGLLLFPPFHVSALREHVYAIAAVPLLLLLLFGISLTQSPAEPDQLPSAKAV